MPGSTLSFDLKERMRAGLATQQREGRKLIYQHAIAQMNGLLACLTAHCCHGADCGLVAVPGCAGC